MAKKRRFIAFALLSAVVAWMLGSRRKQAPPEGIWNDLGAADRISTDISTDD
ncbi:MAG: hypothetical protein ABR507_04025 [Actinomycetota bacterium]|nr:hypothetical protein [Actinomycetota bacterium]